MPDVQPAGPLQALLLYRMAELGISQYEMAMRSEGRIGAAFLREVARGERSEVITRSEAEGIAVALDVPLERVLSVAHLLPED